MIGGMRATHLQGEKANLKKKAEEVKAFQSKACISIPLVDEHTDDVIKAKQIAFHSSESSQDRNRKRLLVETQSVFDSAPSSTASVGSGKLGTKKTRMEEAWKKGGGAFSRPSGASGHQELARTKELRSTLGVKTKQ